MWLFSSRRHSPAAPSSVPARRRCLLAAPLPLREAWFVLLAFATTAVARLIDHLIAGPLPALRAGPPPPPGYNWARFGLCCAAAAAVSLRIGIESDPRRAVWIVVTQIVVM